MSSILDALKRAERESSPDRGIDTPRSPWSQRLPNRQRFRWWWLLLGVGFVFGVTGLIVWQAQRQTATGPAASVGEEPASVKTRDSGTPLTATAPRQAAQPSPTSAVGSTTPPAANPSVQPVTQPGTQPPTAATSPPEPVVPATPLPPVPPVPPQRKTAAQSPDPGGVPAAPKRPPVETAAPTRQPVAVRLENPKTFRNDPRIDLQALVWAPEAATRFVVINNRLIKEGGSVGSIAVVKINPDDVLLAEGSDRWYVAFTVR